MTTTIADIPHVTLQHSRVLAQPLAAPRVGIMLHYDDSSRDDWSLEWFADPRCTNGYTWIAMDDGRLVELADPSVRTPHAGACLTPNANSAYYGLAAATNGVVLVTPAQLETIISTCVALFRAHAWPSPYGGFTPQTAPRKPGLIVGHDAQATWTPAYTRAAGMSDAAGQKLWGKTGRKVDPTGSRLDKRPIIDVAGVRAEVARRLGLPR